MRCYFCGTPVAAHSDGVCSQCEQRIQNHQAVPISRDKLAWHQYAGQACYSHGAEQWSIWDHDRLVAVNVHEDT